MRGNWSASLFWAAQCYSGVQVVLYSGKRDMHHTRVFINSIFLLFSFWLNRNDINRCIETLAWSHSVYMIASHLKQIRVEDKYESIRSVTGCNHSAHCPSPIPADSHFSLMQCSRAKVWSTMLRWSTQVRPETRVTRQYWSSQWESTSIMHWPIRGQDSEVLLCLRWCMATVSWVPGARAQ